MTTTINTAISTTTSAPGDFRVSTRRPVWRVGVLSGLVAAAATCLVVAIARAGDVAVAVQGERIPLLGFAQFTMVGALLGIGLAKLSARRAAHPRQMFVRVTVALTALSIVPDVVVDATVGTKSVLALTHVVAAAIIVPAIASRVPE
jgi:hypothetical protein